MNGITQGYRTGLLLAGSLALALGGTTAVATPEVQMQIEYGGNGGTFPTTTVLIEDNDTNDRTLALGRISFTLDSATDGASFGSGGLGFTQFDFSGGLCTVCPTRIDMTLNASHPGSERLVLMVTGRGLTLPTALPFLSEFNYSGNVGGTTMTTRAFWDPNNEFFGMTEELGSATVTGNESDGLNFSGLDPASPFSLTLRMEFETFSGGVQPQSNVRLSAIPVPGALPLLLGGLGVLGFLGMRRRSATAA